MYLSRKINVFFSITVILLLVVSLPAPMASAQLTDPNCSERKLRDLGVAVINCEGDIPEASRCSVGGSFAGSNNAEVAFNYFRSVGLTPEQSAGIVGNLVAESGVIPNRKQGAGMQTINSPSEIVPGVGFGIAQWTTGGRQANWRQFAIDQGRESETLSLELELDFLLHEFENNSQLGYQGIKDSADMRQATWIFLSFFERPKAVIDAGKAADPVQPTGDNSATNELNNRAGLAQDILDLYGGNSVSTSASGCSGSFNTNEPNYDANPAITVDGSPPGSHKSSNCTGSFTAGAENLRQFVLGAWSPPVTSVGGYSCRSIVGGSATSIHGVGRAIDIMVDATNPEGLRTGNEIRNFLINNADKLGIQRVIWNQKTWTPSKEGWRNYTGTNPHTDHLHVEINIEASKKANLTEGISNGS